MEILVAFIAVMANTVTAGRLICYRRGDCRYRPGISFLAYLLIVCAGGAAIDTTVNGIYVTPWEAGFSSIIAILVCRAGGNVAQIFRMS